MANEVKHTPGPWRFDDAGPMSGNIIRGEIVWSANGNDNYTIAEIPDSAVDAKNKKAAAAMDLANAQLIAAAPEMLELIRDIASYECCCNKQSGKCWQCRARLLATKATAGK